MIASSTHKCIHIVIDVVPFEWNFTATFRKQLTPGGYPSDRSSWGNCPLHLLPTRTCMNMTSVLQSHEHCSDHSRGSNFIVNQFTRKTKWRLSNAFKGYHLRSINQEKKKTYLSPQVGMPDILAKVIQQYPFIQFFFKLMMCTLLDE